MESTTINDRIKAVRKAQKLNQTEFGKQIGLKQMAVSNLEQKGNTVTEKNIFIICQRFHVRRDWLVKGEGEMCDSKENTLFSNFAKQYDLSPAEQNVARFLLTLSSEERQQILKYVTMLAAAINGEAQPHGNAAIDAEVKAYREELEAVQGTPEGKSFPSDNTEDTIDA